MQLIRSDAAVATDRAGRYAKQLVAHMSRKVAGSWDEEVGVGHLEFGVSRVDLTARHDHLSMRLASPPEDLDRLEHVVGIHLARFGAKDALVVRWARSDGTPGSTQSAPSSEQPAN